MCNFVLIFHEMLLRTGLLSEMCLYCPVLQITVVSAVFFYVHV